ncbi:MAG: hypothetical protein AAFV47_10495 [Pseudomonadota bacterium]
MDQIRRCHGVALSLAVALMAGCGGGSLEVDADPVEAEAPEITVSSIAAESADTASISVAYAFDTEPKVGDPLTVSVTVEGVGPEPLALLSSVSGPLALSENTPERIELAAGQTPVIVDIVVTPQDQGLAYLYLQMTGQREARPFTRAMAVPVQVGAGADAGDIQKLLDAGVEVLSSQPAADEIRGADEVIALEELSPDA